MPEERINSRTCNEDWDVTSLPHSQAETRPPCYSNAVSHHPRFAGPVAHLKEGKLEKRLTMVLTPCRNIPAPCHSIVRTTQENARRNALLRT